MANQKTMLITGCSEGGIGDALARHFHAKGIRVFATARNLSKVQHLAKIDIETIQLDVLDKESIRKAVETVKKLSGGGLDYLVNNSGGGFGMPLLDTDTTEAQEVFRLNVLALIDVTNAFVPLLIVSKGTIIGMNSGAARATLPWEGIYSASKAASHSITESYRYELAAFDIKVINVVTGGVKTKFYANVNASSRTLPQGTLYEPARDRIEKNMRGEHIYEHNMDVEEFAEMIVKNVLSRSPYKVHYAGTFIVWFAGKFLWDTFWGILFNGEQFGLGEVYKRMHAAEKIKK